ncbi:hypothetical protein BU15DRAFT_81761 [Melanogaster broomeanus]|nr:hypothetical protein BU15DRAFT_81761 [Melanogaster broomeanus]
MDGLSAAATVLQLLQVAAQVSTALGQYAAAVKCAESSRSKLVDQITLMTTAAKAVGSVLQNPPSSRTPEQQALLMVWFRRDGSAARCKKKLEDLLSSLHNDVNSKKSTRWVKRLIWPVKENRIHAAIRAFEGHMPYFRDILSIDTSIRIQEITSIITSEREHIRNKEIAAARCEIAAEKHKLLEWFDGVDCTVKHESTREQRQKDNGRVAIQRGSLQPVARVLLWVALVKRKRWSLISWRGLNTDDDPPFTLLAVKHLAGAGKSVLASGVIDSLSSGLADDETLAYFYCDFRTPRSTSTMEDLALVNQAVAVEFRDRLALFIPGTGHAQRARPMIVIDALDECEDLSKLLVFAGLSSISLNDKVDAVRNDMYFHISTELESRDRLKILSHDLQVEIRDALMEKADGMFRWVQCQLDRLNGCWSLGHLREVLDTLPRTLYGTYERMLRAIDKTEFGGRVAQRALVWLVTTLQPLTLSQLAEALALNSNNPASDSTNATMHETDLIEICGSLVSFDERTSVITLSHYSVKEYLTSDIVADKAYFVHNVPANFELVRISIYSIMLSINTPEAHPLDLSNYAMRTGFKHLANCAPEDDDPLLGLLFTLQDHVSNNRRNYARKWIFEIWIASISQLALYIIIRTNPLVYAALYRDVPYVQVLLDQGLDVNIEATVTIRGGETRSLPPLIAAAYNHKYQEELVTLLLARGSTVPRNAIHSVLRSNDGGCRPFTIQILLQNGADAMLLEAGGRNCLHLLLQRGYVDPEHSNSISEIARLLPLGMGAFQLVEWLVENRFRLPVDAVLDAVRCPRPGHLLPMLRLLFENDVVADARDDNGCSALHVLLRSRPFDDEAQVAFKALLEKGCSAQVISVVSSFLSDQGAQLPDDIVNYCFASTPYQGNSSAMSLLVRLVSIHGASCQARNIGGDNALHCLLSRELENWPQFQKEPIEELLFLLEKGCDFHATSSSGVTVLGIAIENGYLSIARILLDRFAQLHVDITLADSGDARGNTLLHRLCYKLQHGALVTDVHFMDRLKLLQEAGYDLAKHSIPEQSGIHPPLHPKFSDVNPLFLDNLAWASDLPWYSDATEAYQRTRAKPKITFDDVNTVYHLLVDDCKLPVPAVRCIMEAAEYWAYTKAFRENLIVQTTLTYDIALPVVPSIDTRYWVPRRVMVSYKPRRVTDIYASNRIQLSIRRQNVVYAPPLGIRVQSDPLEPPVTVFDVWDGYTVFVPGVAPMGPDTEQSGPGVLPDRDVLYDESQG